MAHNSVRTVIDRMLSKDQFSRWLGVEVQQASEGSCELTMGVKKEMLNGFGIVHGGVTFSLADTALAVASNSYNRLSVALEASISYPVAVKLGDVLSAKAIELSLTNKIGVYQILVFNQKGETVAIFKGTVYRTSKMLFEDE